MIGARCMRLFVKFIFMCLVTTCCIIIIYTTEHVVTPRDRLLSKSRQLFHLTTRKVGKISKEELRFDQIEEDSVIKELRSQGNRHILSNKSHERFLSQNISSSPSQFTKSLHLKIREDIRPENVVEVDEIVHRKTFNGSCMTVKELSRDKNDGLSDKHVKFLQVRTQEKRYHFNPSRLVHSNQRTNLTSISVQDNPKDKRKFEIAAEYSLVTSHFEKKPLRQKRKKSPVKKTNKASDQQKRSNLSNSLRRNLSGKKLKTLKEQADSLNAKGSVGNSLISSKYRSHLKMGLRRSRGSVEIRNKRTELCHPLQRIVFLKTHKAASTTTASIFERYGYYRNLKFVLGKNHVLSFSAKFSHKNILHFPGMRGKSYDILANHARYNREEMDLVVHNATYVTIVRKPEEQLESAFGYFEMYRGMKLMVNRNPLEAFMEDPARYYQNYSYTNRLISRNGQLFDLGFEHEFDENNARIKTYIRKLNREFDLVLVAEYYDESLILLKKLLCWSFDDILYISNGIRSWNHRFQKSRELINKMRQWNYGDLLLYEHFNKTLWRKIVDYGPTFQNDLSYFREQRNKVLQECVDSTKIDDIDRREAKFILKDESDRCASLLRNDVAYTHLIKKSMLERYS